MMLADITAAIRLGDAPTLRQAFRALVDYPNEERIAASSPGLLLVAFNKVCQALTADHAVMPGALCGLLDMPAGSSFAHGAMVAVQRHHASISRRIMERFAA